MRKLICLLIAIAMLAALAACSAETIYPVPTASESVPPPLTPAPTPVTTPAPSPTPEPFGLPNVYIFIMDEYGALDILSEHYKYDAKVFSDFLTQKGFNISRESYTTDRQTGYCVCDFLNIDHVSYPLTPDEVQAAIDNARLHKIFSDLGYHQFQYSSNYVHEFIKVPSLKTDEGKAAYAAIVSAQGFEGVSPAVPAALSGQLSATEFGKRPDAEALNEWGFYPTDYIRATKEYRENKYNVKADAMLDIFDYYEDPKNYAPTPPRVLFSYMAATHVPFVFNEFGGILPESESRNWQDEKIYLGQYMFLAKRLMASVATIIANDPESIIIIMSDHGIRYHNKKIRITDKESLRIMNAVYVKGEKIDTEGLSAINTMRYVLSLYDGHGADYPPIEDNVTADSPDSLKGILPIPYKE